MYLKHFNLEVMPFEIGPDPKFLWLGSKHQEAFAILNYGIIERKGFVVITGAPGTGKSTLLNAAIASFNTEVRFAKISEPALDTMDFVNFAADAFEMGQSFTSKGQFLIQLKRFIREGATKRLILVIDEAQRVAPEMLEQIRVFSDIDAPGQRAFSCIFAGQPEFLEIIQQNRALCQRIFFSHALQLLTLPETGGYITHRLKVAGCSAPLFTPDAVEEIHKLSKGNPRLINILCDQALLTGYASLKTQIGPDMIQEGTESTLIPLQTATKPTPKPPESELPRVSEMPADTARGTPQALSPPVARTSSRRILLPGVAAVALLGVSGFLYYGGGFPWIHSPANPSSTVDGEPGTNPAGTALRQQLADLQRQKDSADTQLRDLQSSVANLKRELKDLQDAGERSAEREKALAVKESTIAELKHKLDVFSAGQSSASQWLETLQRENSRLQAQLSEANSQKGVIEGRLMEEQNRIAGLSADSQALRSARERVANLEAALSESDKKLARLEQSSLELDKALSREKNARDQAAADLAYRQAAVVDLQKQLETATSLQRKLEADIQDVPSDRARPPDQPREPKAKPQQPAVPRTATVQANSPPAPAAQGRAEVPDPMGAIDYVIKRKSQQ